MSKMSNALNIGYIMIHNLWREVENLKLRGKIEYLKLKVPFAKYFEILNLIYGRIFGSHMFSKLHVYAVYQMFYPHLWLPDRWSVVARFSPWTELFGLLVLHSFVFQLKISAHGLIGHWFQS